MTQLYILNESNEAVPSTLSEVDAWESAMNPEERSSLGKLIANTAIGNCTVTTLFLASPCGFFGRKPQCWLTITAGHGIYRDSRYSSHRACLAGHIEAVSKAKKLS